MDFILSIFLDQPEWIRQIRQQSQSGGGINHAVAYKRIQIRYNDIGQLTFINRFETPTTFVGSPSLRTVLEFDDANRLVLLALNGTLDEVSVWPLNPYRFGYDSVADQSSLANVLPDASASN